MRGVQDHTLFYEQNEMQSTHVGYMCTCTYYCTILYHLLYMYLLYMYMYRYVTKC